MAKHGVISIEGYNADTGAIADDSIAEKINSIFAYGIYTGHYSYPDGETNWTQLTIDEFINGVLHCIPDVPSVPAP